MTAAAERKRAALEAARPEGHNNDGPEQSIDERSTTDGDLTLDVAFGQGNPGKVRNTRRTWGQLCSEFKEPTRSKMSEAVYRALPHEDQRREKAGAIFIFGGHCRDGKRATENVQSRSLIMLDVDGATRSQFLDFRFEVGDSRAGAYRYEFVYYTTRSHVSESPKWRIVIPLKSPIKPEIYPRVARAVAEQFGGLLSAMDAASYVPAQMMYMPVANCDSEFYSDRNAGELLDASHLLASMGATVSPVSATAVIDPSANGRLDADEEEDVFLRHINERRAEDREHDLERLESALPFISADAPRSDWLRVLAGAKGDLGEAARELIEGWSRESGKYDEASFERDWNSLDDRANGVTLGTVFHYAKLGGWVDPRTEVTSTVGNWVDTGGDVSNGGRFAKAYRNLLLFCGALKKWFRWDALRWSMCNVGEPVQLAKRIAAQLLEEAAAELRERGSEEAKQKFRQAVAVHNTERRIHSMLSMAASEPGMQIAHPGELDADPMLLGVRNGVLNLRTGALLTPDPMMLITKLAAAEFNRGATCPQWVAFLEAVFDGDAEVIAFIQRALGYTLTGLVDEEVIFFMYGHGANGKSVFANIIAGIFGDYAVTVGSELLARKQGSESDRFKTTLPGARLALANEVGSGDVWDDQKVKELASRERIAARELYGEAFNFMPTHALWIRGNHKPGIMDAGDGMWRRIVLIPFRRQFGEGERVPDLDRKILDAERDGILRWMVDGCLAWQRGGLKVPEVIQRETAAYRTDTDLLGAWIDEVCTPGADRRLQSGEAYRSYRVFLDGQGVKYPSQIAFVRHMVERGFAAARSNGVRYLTGLDLKSANVDEGDDL